MINAAKVKGRNHDICQDDFYYKEDDNCCIIALSDGAGSKKYSHYGARIATETVSNFLCKLAILVILSSKLKELKSSPYILGIFSDITSKFLNLSGTSLPFSKMRILVLPM